MAQFIHRNGAWLVRIPVSRDAATGKRRYHSEYGYERLVEPNVRPKIGTLRLADVTPLYAAGSCRFLRRS